jgi:pimeloyl-ACP methyl ester carboxylesterase
MGGYGGIRRHAPLRHLPVIFVHGNHVDAANWYPVTDQFLAAGYTDQELYAVSYNGLGSADDVGSCCVSQRELAYWQRPDTTANYASGGVALKDDPNAPDVYAFVRAVQDYTGSKRIEIVAHSFGVTVVRKMLFEHPELYRQVTAAVMIAGGNHGTSLCRGPLEHQYYGCEEVTPGSAWLDRLNSRGEAPGPTHWMTIYNGHDSVDPFFLRGADYDDLQSPHLDGAVNRMYPQTWHNDLRVLPEIVHTYMRFLLRYGAVA